MDMRALVLFVALAAAVLGGCAAKEEAAPPAAAPVTAPVPAPVAAPPPAPAAAVGERGERGERGEAARPAPPPPPAPAPAPAERRLAREAAESAGAAAPERPDRRALERRMLNGGAVARAPASRPAEVARLALPAAGALGAAEFDADAALAARRDAYRNQMRQASYAFNPPTPIKVATPVTVFFWIDPMTEAIRLGEELQAKLRAMRPDETPRVEAGEVGWSPKMRVTLTAREEDFEITPTEGKGFDGVKLLSAERRSEWSWDIKAKHVGERLPLHLKVWAVLPGQLGGEVEVSALDKYIQVDVTWWWLLDEFWEKYWKWLLGGLGTALAGAIGAWWKSRQPKQG